MLRQPPPQSKLSIGEWAVISAVFGAIVSLIVIVLLENR